tara:strand:- start:236 stop:397 length:162 start_codon:yes stop_codon:yes gene_type:complete
MNYDWKKEMDANYKRVKANWWQTGNRTCQTAVSASFQLGKGKDSESTKEYNEK